MRHYYNVLGVDQGADKETIRQAYRKLALQYHPDHNPSPGANATFIEIKDAYDILTGSNNCSSDPDIFEFKQAFQEWQREEMEAKLRQEEKRRRIREAARLQYESFLRNNAHFRSSWYFYPAMLLAYSVLYINRLVSIMLLLAPLAGFFWFSQAWLFLIPVTMVCWLFSFRLLSLATLYRDEISPYFSGRPQPAFRM
ncbi:DnaJ domain-containing protein [Roseivirga sp. BDSF3-8]|uniref:J domain-containing protein n=1 Tax=Roseivirga sp. BDSF3-8 TaxID=3241598 RepID=UPI003531BFF4